MQLLCNCYYYPYDYMYTHLTKHPLIKEEFQQLYSKLLEEFFPVQDLDSVVKGGAGGFCPQPLFMGGFCPQPLFTGGFKHSTVAM